MKTRKDSFWGIHCDFHARPWMGTIGRRLKEEDIRKICRELKPDFWQIDCKGHFGWASYPSKIGNAMPMSGDPLATWRKITREEGVALYIHYSGLWDNKYCLEHPEEAVLYADGTHSDSIAFPMGHYDDDILIPQISELVEKYEIDGVWIDGECWASEVDYHEQTLKAFEKETGICLNGEKPTPGHPYYHDYFNFNRELFRRHVAYYVEVLHKKYPKLQITSNYLFSVKMPEKVSIDVDFISGDTTPFDSLNATRYAARYLPQQNKPWDVMGMAQRYSGEEKIDLLPVHPIQLMQQAAATISLGGAFQFGLSQYFDGAPRMRAIMSFLPVAKFLQEREKFCFKGKIIPQAAMFVSTHDHYLDEHRLFTRGSDGAAGKRGLTALLCNAGQSFEIISEHNLAHRASEFSMIAVPETLHELNKETIKLLLEYAENGGSLLLVGNNTCKLFEAQGAPFKVCELDDDVPAERFLAQRNDAKDQRFLTIDGNNVGAVLYPMQLIGDENCEVIAHTYYDEREKHSPFAIISNYGKGKIAAVSADLGKAYDKATQYLHRDIIKLICEKLYTPFTRIEECCGFVDLVCLKKNDRIMLQLMNGNGNHNNIICDTEDFIPPVLDVKISIAISKPPKEIILQPQGEKLDYTIKDGRVYLTVKRIDMHNIVEIIEE